MGDDGEKKLGFRMFGGGRSAGLCQENRFEKQAGTIRVEQERFRDVKSYG